MRALSVRWRMTIWNTAAFAVPLAGFGISVYWMLRQTHYDQIHRRLRERYTRFLQATRREPADAERFITWLRGIDPHLEITGYVANSAGQIVAKSDDLVLPDALPLVPRTNGQFDTVSPGDGERLRRMVARISTDGRDYTVVLLADLEHLEEEIVLVAQVLGVTVPLTLLISAIVGYLFAKSALAPVEQLWKCD